MIIASVLNKEENIVPIVEGITLRLYNSTADTFEDFENPALHLVEGRRGATLQFAKEKGASVFVSPPQTFCELSYKKAQEKEVTFYHLQESVSFEEFLSSLQNDELHVQKTLPEEEIAPSNVPQS